MIKSYISRTAALGAIFGFVLAMFASPVAVFAQATPESDATAHPAHIHAGVCPEPGDVVFPLNDVIPAVPEPDISMTGTPDAMDSDMTGTPGAMDHDMMGTPDAMDAGAMGTPDAMDATGVDVMPVGTPGADTVMGMESTTTVEASLDDILGAEHAINLHLSADQLEVYIACGDITGTADQGELTIELEEQNDSGLSGHATLTDNGDGTTIVHIEVRHVSVNMDGTPAATPEP